MFPRSTFSIARRVCATVVISSLAGASVSAGPRPAFLRGRDTEALERARAGAARRLGTRECQKVLSDFTDAEGRTLLESLKTWQLGAPGYLHEITFRGRILHPELPEHFRPARDHAGVTGCLCLSGGHRGRRQPVRPDRDPEFFPRRVHGDSRDAPHARPRRESAKHVRDHGPGEAALPLNPVLSFLGRVTTGDVPSGLTPGGVDSPRRRSLRFRRNVAPSNRQLALAFAICRRTKPVTHTRGWLSGKRGRDGHASGRLGSRNSSGSGSPSANNDNRSSRSPCHASPSSSLNTAKFRRSNTSLPSGATGMSRP